MSNNRVIVISNNSFSQTGSNGRTLGNLFIGYQKDSLAQFCISTSKPDYNICSNYYVVTDKEALSSFIRLRKARRCDISNCVDTEANTKIVGNKRSFKTASKALIRHFVWKSVWNSREFWRWVDDFNPDIVLLMNSDSAFILDIAKNISIKKRIPLLMFNTEGFYFYKKDYMREESLIDRICFPLYQYIYRRTFRNVMSHVNFAVYLNQLLLDDYLREFPHKAYVLYTSSDVVFDESDVDVKEPVFSYFGNFGFNRPKALIEISEVLQSINHNYKLDVYGKYPSDDVRIQFENAPGINSKGFVPYPEIKNIINRSTILFHAEVQDERFQESLRHGFSTKIADCVTSGHPFVMYSSSQIAGAQYIIETGAGWHAGDREQLKNAIVEILENEQERLKVKDLANKARCENHDFQKNCHKMREIIELALKSERNMNDNIK